MQIVIDIPKEDYLYITKKHCLPSCDDKTLRKIFYEMISSGTLLPKEHGRLVDGSRIEQHLQQKLLKYGIFPQYKQGLEMALNDVVKIADTIIEPDKENTNENGN